MKISRQIGILSVLMQRDTVTAAELTEKFEVSLRTVYRDIEDMCMAGIPIGSIRGRSKGGFYIEKDFKLDRAVLSKSDMKALLTGLQALDSVDGTSRRLMDKLCEQRNSLMNTAGGITIDLSGWDRSAVSEKIGFLRSAMDDGKEISFGYLSPESENGDENVRIVDPIRLVFEWSSWYVWGYCKLRNDFRLFRLSRMTDLKRTGKNAEEREIPEFSCDKLRHTRGKTKVTVRFDKAVKWRIYDEFGTDLSYDENGDVILTFTWQDDISLYRFLLSFGDKAEIISPARKREEFKAELKKMLSVYD
ncbi:MAG: YafY family transcriptional regulator, partial [Ruminococcus sp.]|nr:YafY family transcriptional regulator [Ruminococcus sp.]